MNEFAHCMTLRSRMGRDTGNRYCSDSPGRRRKRREKKEKKEALEKLKEAERSDPLGTVLGAALSLTSSSFLFFFSLLTNIFCGAFPFLLSYIPHGLSSAAPRMVSAASRSALAFASAAYRLALNAVITIFLWLLGWLLGSSPPVPQKGCTCCNLRKAPVSCDT